MIAEFRKGELWDTTFIVSKRKGEMQKRRRGVLVWGRREK